MGTNVAATELWVVKRSGKVEPFDREKLERSLRAAGAPDPDAREVVHALIYRRRMSTRELRAQVISELRRWDPVIAQRYEWTRTLPPHAQPDLDEETVAFHPETLEELGLEAERLLPISHNGYTLHLAVRAVSDTPQGRVGLHPRIWQLLRLSPESKVALHGAHRDR